MSREQYLKLRKACRHQWGFGPGRQDKEFCELCGTEREWVSQTPVLAAAQEMGLSAELDLYKFQKVKFSRTLQ